MEITRATMLTIIPAVAIPVLLWLYRRRQSHSPRNCPVEPYLTKLGMQGRRQGPFEAALDYGQVTVGLMINVNAVFISCKRQLSKAEVLLALRKLYQRHPLLRVKSVVNPEKSSERYFAFFEEVQEPVLQELATGDWKNVLHDEMNTRFRLDNLQWRMTMLNPAKEADRWLYPFVVAFNHCIVDGGSIMDGFVTDFHKYLDGIVTGNDRGLVESLPMLPTRDVILPQLETNWWDRILKLLPARSDTHEPDKVIVTFLEQLRPPVETERKTRLMEFHLSASTTTNIISACQRRGIKVNGYLTAAAVFATVNLLKRKATINDDFLDISTSYMVNLRRFAHPPIPTGQLMNMASFVPLEVKSPIECTEHTFWALAKQCHEGVHNGLAKGIHMTEAKALAYDLAEHLVESMDQWCNFEYPFSAFTLTNRGNFNVVSEYPEHPDHCAVEGVYWACADHCFNASIVVHSVLTLNSRTMWSMAYCTHKTTEENAQEYVGIIESILEEYCTS
jgi:hypothetical protein